MNSEERGWLERLRKETPIRGLFAFEELESTNKTARILLRQVLERERSAGRLGELGNGTSALPFLVAAKRQTAGRGRGNHRWWSPEGGLFLTAAAYWRDFGLTRDESVELSLKAARSTAKTIRETLLLDRRETGNDIFTENDILEKIWVKPPNDIYIDGKKGAGILIESPAAETLLIGIGVNLNNTAKDAPEEIRQKTASLRDITGKKIDTAEFVVRLMKNLFLAQV